MKRKEIELEQTKRRKGEVRKGEGFFRLKLCRLAGRMKLPPVHAVLKQFSTSAEVPRWPVLHSANQSLALDFESPR